MHELNYLAGYPEAVRQQAARLLAEGRLGDALRRRYPAPHDIRTDRALYAFVMALKNEYLRGASPVSRIAYDRSISAIHNALGLHTYVSRVQGGRLKAKNEIRIASVVRHAPLAFLRMVAVHELAHLKERDHSKAFYQLCQHMEPDYHQLELDLRLYLTHLETAGPLYRDEA